MVRRLTNKEFIEKLAIANPTIEATSEYTTSIDRIAVKCKKCFNEWSMLANNALRGRKCPKCSRAKSHEDFKKDLEVNNNKVELIGRYTSVKTKVEVKCLVCNRTYFARPDQLLDGCGCSICSNAKRRDIVDKDNINELAKSKTLTLLDFPESVGGNIVFECLLCNIKANKRYDKFLERPYCRKCSALKYRKSHSQFVEECKVIHKNITILGQYNTCKSNIECLCSCGNVWNPIASDLLAGYGCPKCNTAGYSQGRPAEFYIYYIHKCKAFGYGITNNPKQRDRQHCKTFKDAGSDWFKVMSVHGNGDAILEIERFAKRKIPVYNTGLKGFINEAMLPKDVYKLILHIDRMIEDGAIKKRPLLYT